MANSTIITTSLAPASPQQQQQHQPSATTVAPEAEQQHDLAAIDDGLFGNFDLQIGLQQATSGPDTTPTPSLDPKQARLNAAFQRARAEYTVKVEDQAWFLPGSSSLRDQDGHVELARFLVPSPTELRQARIQNKRQSLDQEWTIDYLYSIRRFDLGLAYATSFLYSMDLPLDLDLQTDSHLVPVPQPAQPRDDSNAKVAHAQKPAKGTGKAKATEIKGPTKELLDSGIRCVLSLIRESKQSTSSDPSYDPTTSGNGIDVSVWRPRSSDPIASTATSATISPDGKYVLQPCTVRSIALGLLSVGHDEVRRGAAEADLGQQRLVQPCSETGRLIVNPSRLKAQNWTIFPGLALSLGQLSVEMGLDRMAVDSLALFLAARGAHWRGLVPCAFALDRISARIGLDAEGKVAADERNGLKASLDELVKALTVLALQSAPKQRRTELARLVVNGNVIGHRLVDSTLTAKPSTSTNVEAANDDGAVLDVLLCEAAGTLLARESVVALCCVVCERKGGVSSLAGKLRSYLESCRGDRAEVEEGEEGDEGHQPRSVKTL